MYSVTIDAAALGALSRACGEGRAMRVTYAALEEYGCAVVDAMRRRGDDAILLWDRYRTAEFARDNADILDVDEPSGGYGGIRARDGVTLRQVSDRLAGGIPVAVFCALYDEESVAALDRAVAERLGE